MDAGGVGRKVGEQVVQVDGEGVIVVEAMEKEVEALAQDSSALEALAGMDHSSLGTSQSHRSTSRCWLVPASI